MLQEGQLIENESHAQFGAIVARLRKGKGSQLSLQRKTHTCTHALCAPECETSMIQHGTLHGPPISNNVYLCNFGTVHICSETSCSLYGYTKTQTCPLSGLEWGSMVSTYDKNDYRTWHHGGREVETNNNYQSLKRIIEDDDNDNDDNKKEENQQKAKKRRLIMPAKISKETALERGRTLVDTLLYSNARRHRNMDALEEFQRQAENAKQTYIAGRLKNRQLPFLTDILRLVGNFCSQPLPLIEYPRDENVLEYYAHVIYQVWCKVLDYCDKQLDEDGNEIPPRVDYETVGMGVLYTMRDGLQCSNVMVLPEDHFLVASLPDVRDMNYFGIQKRKVTLGNNLLKKIYKAAIVKHYIRPEQLVLDAAQLPAKDVKSRFTKLG